MNDDHALSYAIISPVRDEVENLEQLAQCLIAQTRKPSSWLIVDDGSSDGTRALVIELARHHPWIHHAASAGGALARGGPIVRAFHTGLEQLDPVPDVVVKLDADITMEPDHFERLLDAFACDSSLGIAGGVGYEEDENGNWRQRHGTGAGVWGANRAYRRECLRDIGPLHEHMGWDSLDLMKANMTGWRTEVVPDLPFRHHRAEGKRDGSRYRTFRIQGEAANYMAYRFSYLFVRTLYRALRDPAAIGLIVGYVSARARRQPRCPDVELRRYVRHQQSLRMLPTRVREALRPRAVLADRGS